MEAAKAEPMESLQPIALSSCAPPLRTAVKTSEMIRILYSSHEVRICRGWWRALLARHSLYGPGNATWLRAKVERHEGANPRARFWSIFVPEAIGAPELTELVTDAFRFLRSPERFSEIVLHVCSLTAHRRDRHAPEA